MRLSVLVLDDKFIRIYYLNSKKDYKPLQSF